MFGVTCVPGSRREVEAAADARRLVDEALLEPSGERRALVDAVVHKAHDEVAADGVPPPHQPLRLRRRRLKLLVDGAAAAAAAAAAAPLAPAPTPAPAAAPPPRAAAAPTSWSASSSVLTPPEAPRAEVAESLRRRRAERVGERRGARAQRAVERGAGVAEALERVVDRARRHVGGGGARELGRLREQRDRLGRRVVVERDEHVRRARAELRHQLVLRAEEEEQLGAERVADADDGQRLGGAAVARELAVDEGAPHLRVRAAPPLEHLVGRRPVVEAGELRRRRRDDGEAVLAERLEEGAVRLLRRRADERAADKVEHGDALVLGEEDVAAADALPEAIVVARRSALRPSSLPSACDAAASSPNQSCESYVPATCRRIGRERDGTGNCG